MCHAHAGPCLSTGWTLNRRFGLTSGTAAVLAQGGGGTRPSTSGSVFSRAPATAPAPRMNTGSVTEGPPTEAGTVQEPSRADAASGAAAVFTFQGMPRACASVAVRCSSSPDTAFQIRTVLSLEPEITVLPSVDRATVHVVVCGVRCVCGVAGRGGVWGRVGSGSGAGRCGAVCRRRCYQRPGCPAHGKMQTGWAPVLGPECDRNRCAPVKAPEAAVVSGGWTIPEP